MSLCFRCINPMNSIKIIILSIGLFFTLLLVIYSNFDNKEKVTNQINITVEEKNTTIIISAIPKQNLNSLLQNPIKNIPKIDYSSYSVIRLISMLEDPYIVNIKDIMKVLWIKSIDDQKVLLAFDCIKQIQERDYREDVIAVATLIINDLERFLSQEEYHQNESLDILKNELFSTNPKRRLAATHKIANYRNHASLIILKQALYDELASIRLAAVKGLWFMAADGFDDNGEIVYELSLMIFDEDKKVSQTAKLAVDDLKKLKIHNETKVF